MQFGFSFRTDQALVEALKTIGQLERVETQQVQDRGLQVSHVHWVLGGVVADVVGLPLGLATFDSAARQQHRRQRHGSESNTALPKELPSRDGLQIFVMQIHG